MQIANKKIFRRKAVLTVKNFFKSRGLGFYFTAGAVLLSLIQLIIYSTAFSTVDFVKYKHWTVIFCSVLAILSGIGLSCTKWTERFAPLAAFVCALASFLMFIRYGYMYFTELFFAGVSAEAISQMYYGYMGSIILYVLIWGVSIAAFFLRQSKRKNNEGVEAV